MLRIQFKAGKGDYARPQFQKKIKNAPSPLAQPQIFMDDISHLDETKELKVIYLSQPIRRKILPYHNNRFLKFLRSIFKAYLKLPEISSFFAWEAKIMTYVLISQRNTNAYLGNCHSCLYFRIPLKLWKDEGQLAALTFHLVLPGFLWHYHLRRL